MEHKKLQAAASGGPGGPQASPNPSQVNTVSTPV
ncbi:hypothetical protein SAMN04489710_11678 [Paracidovorax konjaci]|uniref:Uncharacterized protein n=1 Tax=Paracidovorax konjaci TaxID=32040 RepID=A0A1I1Y947_9BURK|nr:hypothetical protein SAMN04489710_11678 [Paracidovorax konjaci]